MEERTGWVSIERTGSGIDRCLPIGLHGDVPRGRWLERRRHEQGRDVPALQR